MYIFFEKHGYMMQEKKEGFLAMNETPTKKQKENICVFLWLFPVGCVKVSKKIGNVPKNKKPKQNKNISGFFF